MPVVRGGMLGGGVASRIRHRTSAVIAPAQTGLPDRTTTWDCSATVTGTARMSAAPPSMTFALKAHVIGRADGYAHAEQPTPPAALSPYGGLSD